MHRAKPYPSDSLYTMGEQKTYSGHDAIQIAMPLGGIGAGCISINGSGGLQDFSVRGKPHTTAVPDSHSYHPSAFAVLHIKGEKAINRVVEGPIPREKIYSFGVKSQGFRQGGQEGFPHFENAEFKGEFPFAYVSLSEQGVPVSAEITAFNPFIPLDDKNSSIPCAIMEYTLKNTSGEKVEFEFSFNMSHPTPEGSNTVIPDIGVYMNNDKAPDSEDFGSAAFGVVGASPLIKGMWLRGGWFDSISVLWHELSAGTFTPNEGSNDVDRHGNNGGSLLIQGSLQPGESQTYPIVVAWYFPNRNFTFGQPKKEQQCCCGDDKCCEESPSPQWKTYYSSQWTDARDVLEYTVTNYDSLKSRTEAFHDKLFSSTLPDYVLDAVSANLGILKSPTVLREFNGNIWAFEGCFCDSGCCEGSCTHVWNYAQAMPHLFPQLERTLRSLELERSMDEKGHVAFRGALPDGPASHNFHAAADGQLGGIMKLYRDYLIGGDLDWLKRLYPNAKKSLNYCIETWDPDHLGVLIEPHHNTYDIEFWGPDGMCSSIYLGALTAMAQMAREVGKSDEAPYYEEIAAKGVQYLDENLFDGEYYHQKVSYKDLRNQSFMERISVPESEMGEVQKLLKKEGPSYQYGTGCISDGVIGAWMAKIYGIPTPQTSRNVQSTLESIFAYNFKEDLWEHENPQRPGFGLGHEPGLLLCTWPKGGRPVLPFVYSDEVWTGIEYQVASHLIEEGFVEEGLTIVKAVRIRYNGETRNPWNEYECGNYYARALSSYAVLNSLSGFRYARSTKTLWFGPKLSLERFKTFFSTQTGFGTVTVENQTLTINMTEGFLDVEKLVFDGKEIACSIYATQDSPGAINL